MQGFPFALVAVLAFNTGIAGLLTLVRYGNSFGGNFVFSQCIGLSVLLLIHAGWRVLWPLGKPPRLPFLGLIAFGIVAGWLGGSAIAAALLGLPWTAGRSAVAALGVTVAAGFIGTGFFWSRHRAAELERGRIEAQLKLLQAQIEPHFLFNALANLDALIATDPPRARACCATNDYLRSTLAATRRERNTLADEFALLRGYLEVQAMRMGERLRCLELPAPLADRELPPLLLQPLVENAIKHGLEPKVKGGEVRVSACADGSGMVLEVADDGLGAATPATAGTGVGLSNLRARLAAAYDGAARVQAGAGPAGGYTVTVSLPR